ncbi:MAG: response regulator [Chloroflexi bacterium]|nr:response regulator [Chloroflexota bacterium]
MRTGSILIIDRTERVRARLSALLDAEGYTVRCASTGADALALLQASEFDVVLAELHLEDIQSRGVLMVVRRRWPKCVAIILIAHSSIQSAVAAMHEHAAYDYLFKPCVSGDVLAKVARGLERNWLRREVELYTRQLAVSIDTARELYSRLDARLFETLAVLDDRDRQAIRFWEELKAPLLAISSLAELLQGRLVQALEEPDYGPRFAAIAGDLVRHASEMQSHANQMTHAVSSAFELAHRRLPQAERMGLNPGEVSEGELSQLAND